MQNVLPLNQNHRHHHHHQYYQNHRHQHLLHYLNVHHTPSRYKHHKNHRHQHLLQYLNLNHIPSLYKGHQHLIVMGSSVLSRKTDGNVQDLMPTMKHPSLEGQNIVVTCMQQIEQLYVAIQSQFDRGFFLVGTDWTCYRRNYFQISSTLSLQDVVGLNDGEDIPCYVRDDKDTLHKVQQFYVGIGAEISNFGKQVTLIQHTAKRDKGPLHSPGPIPIHPVGNTSLGTLGADHSLAVFERIQFRTATANNGKGRALQQHFVVVMEILAKTESSDELIPVATTTSQPLVVRGRSPGHYGDSSSAAPIIHEHQPYPHHQHPATFPPTYPHAGVLMMSNGASPSSTTGTYYYPQPQSPTAPLRPTPPVKREPSLAPQQPPPAHPNVYSYSYYSPPHSRPSESPHYTDHQPVKDEHPRRIQDHQYQQQQQYQEHAIPPTSHHRHVIDPSSSGHDNDNAPSPVADSTTFDQTPQQPILIDDNHSISTPPVQRCFDIRESRLRAPPQSDVRTPTTWKQWHPPSQQKGDSASRRKKIRTSNNGAGKKGASSSK
ncbi:unnamed protein product [Absidia cylindrospora]